MIFILRNDSGEKESELSTSIRHVSVTVGRQNTFYRSTGF